MIVKSRQVSDELKLMRILNARMELEDKDKQNYFNLEKGFEGELKFDTLMANRHQERLILNDLLLEKNNTKFQLDSVHIAQGTIYHYEVKNYEGDYIVESDRFYTLSGKEILSPFHQVKRSESLLRQLLQSHGYSIPLESYLVFIHPEFYLYNAPKDPSIIFPNQLNRFLRKMNIKPSVLNGKHLKLAEQLVALNLLDDPYKRVPPYTYEGVRKGMMCGSCYSFDVSVGRLYTICNDCKCTEENDHAILRSISEFQLLFPDSIITTSIIYDWCKVIKSVKTIRRNLAKNFKQIGYGKWVYYDDRT